MSRAPGAPPVASTRRLPPPLWHHERRRAPASRRRAPMIDTLKNDLKEAMRRADAITVGTLRMLISQFQYARIQTGKDLGEEEAIALLQRAVKTRRESIAQFLKGGRAELAAKEEAAVATVERD